MTFVEKNKSLNSETLGCAAGGSVETQGLFVVHLEVFCSCFAFLEESSNSYSKMLGLVILGNRIILFSLCLGNIPDGAVKKDDGYILKILLQVSINIKELYPPEQIMSFLLLHKEL